MNRDHSYFEELTAAHALHALEPEEEQLLAEHLQACAPCGRELEAHRGTAAQLAHAAPPVPMPEGLLARLHEAVAAQSPGAFETTEVTPLRPSRHVAPALRRRRPALLASAAAAAVLLVGGLLGTTLIAREQTQQVLARGERLSEAVRAMETSPARSVLLRDDAKDVAAVAVLHAETVSLVVDGLAPNADSSTYVLWEISRYGGTSALGTFDVRGDGVEVLRDLPLRVSAGDVAAFAVTREPGSTAPAVPGSAPVASGAVEA